LIEEGKAWPKTLGKQCGVKDPLVVLSIATFLNTHNDDNLSSEEKRNAFKDMFKDKQWMNPFLLVHGKHVL
jgi:hypothetical protein